MQSSKTATLTRLELRRRHCKVWGRHGNTFRGRPRLFKVAPSLFAAVLEVLNKHVISWTLLVNNIIGFCREQVRSILALRNAQTPFGMAFNVHHDQEFIL